MTDRWEYKLIHWASSTKFVNEGTHPGGQPKRKQYWKSEFKIIESGREPETLLASSSHVEDAGAKTASIQDLLNEFGAEGWELVSETVLDTTIVTSQIGWPKAGTPIEIRWTLKRRVES